jgi:hypothetical protein
MMASRSDEVIFLYQSTPLAEQAVRHLVELHLRLLQRTPVSLSHVLPPGFRTALTHRIVLMRLHGPLIAGNVLPPQLLF